MVVYQSYAAEWAGEGTRGRDGAPLGVKGGKAEGAATARTAWSSLRALSFSHMPGLTSF